MIGKILAVGFVCAGAAFGQTATAPAAAGAPAVANSVPTSTATPAPAATAAAAPATTAATAPVAAKATAYTFDVVSIRQNKTPPTVAVVAEDGPTADGYRSHQSLLLLLLTAYVPQVDGAAFYTTDQIKGIPDWSMNEHYDVDARIADQDRAQWQKPGAQKRMLQSMLQVLLADRCKLAVHREMKEGAVYSLVLAKGGPKFKQTDPTVEHPAGYKLPGGAEEVMTFTKDGMSRNMYGISMASLASMLSMSAGRPVQDKTGLTGKYDITMKQPAPSGTAPGEQQDVTAASDPGGPTINSMVNDLGLKLESTKGQVETLVIDHMERPSEN